jgi:hypothetical protein
MTTHANARAGDAGAGFSKPDGLEDQHSQIDRHRQAARAIGNGLLVLPGPCDLAVILRHRLTRRRRTWLAVSATMSLPEDLAERLAWAAWCGRLKS